MASRRYLKGAFKGKTNFEAVVDHFGLAQGLADTGPKLAPNTIYLVSAAVFRSMYTYDQADAARVLACQLGLKTIKSGSLRLAAIYISTGKPWGITGRPST